MPGSAKIPLQPVSIDCRCAEWDVICEWDYTDTFVRRLLLSDIPQRVATGLCRLFVYREPTGNIVGFGSLDVCTEYKILTNGKLHPHIPLLAVNPAFLGRGHGGAILDHLIEEAGIVASQLPNDCHDVLFLEVYATNSDAIRLYESRSFVNAFDTPLSDDVEGKDYRIMFRRVARAGASGT